MTKTHDIDGVTYKEVARMAKEGDKVVHVDDGIVTEVEDVGVTISGYTCPETGDEVIRISEGYYRVLEPIDTPPTDDLLEIVSNLTRRVHELERDNKKIRDDVTETLGTITDLLRRRDRRIEEIERKVFDTSALKTYSLAELNGKKVTLLHGKDGDYEVLTAKDEDGSFYVISEKVGLR